MDQWTFTDGSQGESQCLPCRLMGQHWHCMGGATARVTIQALNVDAELIPGSVSSELRAAFALDISSVLEVAKESVIDLFGNSASSTLAAATVAGRQGLKITAFVTVPASSSANAFANQLYTDRLRALIATTVEELLSSPVLLGDVGVQTVAIKPEPFVPLQPTTTATSTTGTTGSITGTTKRHLDMMTTSTSAAPTSNETTSTTTRGDRAVPNAAPAPSHRSILIGAGMAAITHISFS